MTHWRMTSPPALGGTERLAGSFHGDDTQPLPELFSFPVSFTLAGFRQAAWDVALVILAVITVCSFAAAVGLISWALFFWK